MSKREKILQKIKNNPTNVKFETLRTLLLHYGFKERQPKSGSSHYTYTYKNYILTIPKHKPVNQLYVKKFIEILSEIDNISN